MWDRINNVAELKARCEKDKSFVGVSANGALYIYNFTKTRAEKLNVLEATERLQVDADTIAEIIASKGVYRKPVSITPIIVKAQDKSKKTLIMDELSKVLDKYL